MIIMGATEDFRSSTNPIKRNNFFHHNLSYHQQLFLLSVHWHGHARHGEHPPYAITRRAPIPLQEYIYKLVYGCSMRAEANFHQISGAKHGTPPLFFSRAPVPLKTIWVLSL